MLQINLTNSESTKEIKIFEITDENLEDLYLSEKNYEIKSIYFNCFDETHLEHGFPWLNGFEFSVNDYNYLTEIKNISDLYNILETLQLQDIEELKKLEDIAECAGTSIFEINEDYYTVFDSWSDYYNYCDEILEDCESDFFRSRLSFYFDWKKYHNDCSYDAYEGSNGYIVYEC